MEIKFENKHQVSIADMLWDAKNEDAVKEILATYGKDAEVVYSMMVSHYLDSVTDTELANEVIRSVK